MVHFRFRRHRITSVDWASYPILRFANLPTASKCTSSTDSASRSSGTGEAATIPDVIPSELLPDQKRAVDAMKTFREKAFGYAQLQATRPQLLGYALADSPAGQAAWIYDIFNGGTGNMGRPETVLSRDEMLDEITLYWLTDTAAPSARLYLEQAQLLGNRNNPGRVDLPVAVSVFPHDLPAARSWAPQVYPKLFYWHELDRGGHFASLEVPELFTEELRRSFRSIRRN